MEIGREDENVGMSMSPRVAGSIINNDFCHHKEFMSQAYLQNKYSEIDIDTEDSNFDPNRPLPIFLKVLGSNAFKL